MNTIAKQGWAAVLLVVALSASGCAVSTRGNSDGTVNPALFGASVGAGGAGGGTAAGATGAQTMTGPNNVGGSIGSGSGSLSGTSAMSGAAGGMTAVDGPPAGETPREDLDDVDSADDGGQ